MTGMNASVSAGWYTFTNLGPVTTTFTPAPSCTASDRVALGYLNPTGNYLYLAYATEPTSTPDFKGCTPTPSPTTTDSVESSVHITSDEQMSAFMAHRIDWRGFGAYYSPGLHCPSGWETMGTAARDASSSLSSSGVFVPTQASTSTQSYSTDDMYYYMFNYEDPASVLKDLLEPKETMVACCPSSMTVDSNGYCYSQVKDYKPTVGYQVGVGYNYKYGTTTEVYTSTSDSTPIVETAYERYETATTYHTDTYTHSLHGAEKTSYHAYSYAPMITMLHHESDLQSASASGAASAAADAATTSNGAARISGASIWGGLGSVVGIWAAGAALGAVMILPW